MQKPIDGRKHGMLDYATVAATAAAPRALGFPERAEYLAYGLAAGYLGLSLLTDYPLSAKRVLPFKAHGATEMAIGMALPFLPRLLGFSENRRARDFFLGLTALTAAAALLTDWNAPDADRGLGGELQQRMSDGLDRTMDRVRGTEMAEELVEA